LTITHGLLLCADTTAVCPSCKNSESDEENENEQYRCERHSKFPDFAKKDLLKLVLGDRGEYQEPKEGEEDEDDHLHRSSEPPCMVLIVDDRNCNKGVCHRAAWE